MSKWTHAICERCWRRIYGDRSASRLIDPMVETCCWCGHPTNSGLYVREDPDAIPNHKDHDEP